MIDFLSDQKKGGLCLKANDSGKVLGDGGIVAIYLPTKPHTYPSPRRKAGLLIAAGNTPDSYLSAMTLDTKRTLVLLQEILLALRANDAEGFKGKARSLS